MDERLQNVETQKQQALNQTNTQFGTMLENNQNLYDQQNQYATEYEQTQNEMADKNLAYQTQLQEQNKVEAEQNKQVESNQALNQYTSAINPYGIQAENMAASGVLSSGVSETSKLAGFNTYQNRLASANQVYQEAVTSFNNAITAATLENDATKAENALTKLQLQLQASSDFTGQQNSLLQNQLSNQQALESQYQSQYNTVYSQIMQEQQQAEAIRQYNEQFEYQKQQDALSQQNYERELAMAQQELSYNIGGGSSSSSLSGESSGGDLPNISTEYYEGAINPDAQYGTFSNGYQPNNVGGSKLTKTGDTYYNQTQKLNGTGLTVSQNIWQDEQGNRYYWEGRENQYIKI